MLVTGEVASADVEAACNFVDSIDEVIKDEAYLSEQIFNVDETGLFCKQMPAHTSTKKSKHTWI